MVVFMPKSIVKRVGLTYWIVDRNKVPRTTLKHCWSVRVGQNLNFLGFVRI